MNKDEVVSKNETVTNINLFPYKKQFLLKKVGFRFAVKSLRN